MAPQIVIIGGGVSGLYVTRSVAKKIPSANVKLIAPNKEFYSNPAAPRLLVEPELVDKAFINIPEALKKRNQEFINAKVEHVDFESKQVTLDNGEKVEYDYLVIASGSRSGGTVFKIEKDSDETKQALKNTSKDIKDAKSVAIIGGGPTGVELAGEVASTYKDKKVTLYTGANQPLPVFDAKRGKAATSKLKALKVNVINSVVVDYELENGKYKVTEKDSGKVENFDYAIKAFGVFPNSSFVEKSYLDAQGFVKVDEYFRVSNAKDVYAFGDIASGTQKTIVDIMYNQNSIIDAVLDKDINKTSTNIKSYTPFKPNTQIVPISKQGGVGVAFGWGLPNFLVKKLKAATFMIEKAKDFV